MGLFSNNKKLCPICGNPTPRLLATKIEGTPICSDCSSKADLPDGVLNGMTMSDFETYLSVYEENKPLRDRFTKDYIYNIGWGGSIVLDIGNRLLRINDTSHAFAFEASNVKSFRITEGSKPLFEGNVNGLMCYETDIEERVSAMSPQLSQYMMQKRELEFRKEMERERAEKRGETPRYISTHIELPVPFQHFNIEIVLEHPYWKSKRWEKDAPTFSITYPSVENYLNEYNNMKEDLHVLALNLMQIINPGAPEQQISAQMGFAAQMMQGMPIIQGMPVIQAAPVTQTAAPAVDAVAEIQKYKGLLDAGIITEEEFAAKKRQLLGI